MYLFNRTLLNENIPTNHNDLTKIQYKCTWADKSISFPVGKKGFKS